MESRPASPPPRESDDWWWICDPRQSLRAGAALFFGLGMALFTALLVWLAGRSLEQSFVQQLGGNFETLAGQMSDKLDRTIYERSHTLQLAASLPALRDLAASPAERRRFLSSVQDSSPDFAWIGYAERSGRIVAATAGLLEGSSADMRPWFRGAREQPFVGPPQDPPAHLPRAASEAGTDSDPRVFDLAVPVTDLDGRFAGILAAQVRWSWARDVQRSVVPEAARRERIGVTVYAANGEVLIDSGGSGWTSPPEAPALPGPRAVRGHLIEPTSGGTTYLTGFARSRGFRDHRSLGWVTAVRQPREQALAPVTELRRTIARWGFIFTFVGMTGAWYFAGRTSRRLRSVRTAATRISEGDVLAALPSAQGEPEIEQMCGALGRMVDRLRTRPEPPPPPIDPSQPFRPW